MLYLKRDNSNILPLYFVKSALLQCCKFSLFVVFTQTKKVSENSQKFLPLRFCNRNLTSVTPLAHLVTTLAFHWLHASLIAFQPRIHGHFSENQPGYNTRIPPHPLPQLFPKPQSSPPRLLPSLQPSPPATQKGLYRESRYSPLLATAYVLATIYRQSRSIVSRRYRRQLRPVAFHILRAHENLSPCAYARLRRSRARQCGCEPPRR